MICSVLHVLNLASGIVNIKAVARYLAGHLVLASHVIRYEIYVILE